MTKRTKSKGGHKHHEDTSFLLESPMPQTHGIGEYVLPGLLFLIFVLGGSTLCWFTLQQQSSIEHLAQSYSAMQMRMTKFQQTMGMRDAQTSLGSQVEERILALEETQRQAQTKVAVALETTQQLKNSDLSSQVWSLHAELDARQAEVEQAAVSTEALKAAVRNKSEEIEAVKRSVSDILGANSALAVSVSGLSGAVAGLEAKLHDQVEAVAGLTAGLQGQAGELGELAVSMDLHKVALEANNQQFAEIKELLVAEQTRRALALEEQLRSVKRTLDDQLSSSQNLHSNLKAQLEAVHSQITIGAQPGSEPEEMEPLTEEALPLAEEEEEASSPREEEQEASSPGEEEQEASSVGEEEQESASQEQESASPGEESSSLGEEPSSPGEEPSTLGEQQESAGEESSSPGEEQEATEEQVKETVDEELAELAPVDESAGQEQEVEPEPEPVEQQETEESSELTGAEEQGDPEEPSEEEVKEEEVKEEEQAMVEEPSEEEVKEEEQATVEEEPVELPGDSFAQEELA